MKRKLLYFLWIALIVAQVPKSLLAENTLSIGISNSSSSRTQMGDDPLYKRAYELFEQAHPNVKVIMQEESDSALYADIQSDVSAYDLISVYNFDLEDLQQRSLLVNLLADESIAAYLKRWPQLLQFMCNGSLLAVPMQVRLELMCVANTSLLETIGVTIPENGWTWNDFYEIGETLAVYNQANGSEYLLVQQRLIGFPFPYCVQQYVNENVHHSQQPIRFDTSVFRSLLEGWKRMIDLNVVDLKNFGSNDSTCLFSLEIIRFDELDKKLIVPLPAYQPGIHSNIAIADYFVIPANSKQQDFALEFLSYLANPDQILMEARGHRYAEAGILVEGDEVFFEGLDKQASKLGLLQDSSLPTDENYALWQEQYNLATLHTASGFDSAVSAMVCDYLQDEMSLDECITRLEEYVETSP